jgi:hypothetical protein
MVTGYTLNTSDGWNYLFKTQKGTVRGKNPLTREKTLHFASGAAQIRLTSLNFNVSVSGTPRGKFCKSRIASLTVLKM